MTTDQVLDLLRDTAEQVVNPRFRALRDDQVAEKGPGDLVTVADRESERLITAALQAAHPDAVVLGEETTATDPGLMGRFRAADHAFTVDPIDGTQNFVAGSPDHALMVAEIRGGATVRGWIWQPQHGRAYVAERGAGAWCDGRRLTRPPVGVPPHGVVSRREPVGDRLDGLPPLELTWLCCGVDYPQLVQGGTDYVIYPRVGAAWDHAPGTLLATEAGAVVGTSEGEPYRPQSEQSGALIAAADRATLDRVRAAWDVMR